MRRNITSAYRELIADAIREEKMENTGEEKAGQIIVSLPATAEITDAEKWRARKADKRARKAEKRRARQGENEQFNTVKLTVEQMVPHHVLTCEMTKSEFFGLGFTNPYMAEVATDLNSMKTRITKVHFKTD